VEQDMEKGLSLARRVHPKYSPVFDKLCEADRAAVAFYFLPHTSEKDVLEVTRPRVIKWYCPFADQREFPSGHRYCINVYTGCEHECQYCYVAGYSAAQLQGSFSPRFVQGLAGVGRPQCPARTCASVEQHRSASAVGASASPHAVCAGKAGRTPKSLYNRYAVDQESRRANG